MKKEIKLSNVFWDLAHLQNRTTLLTKDWGRWNIGFNNKELTELLDKEIEPVIRLNERDKIIDLIKKRPEYIETEVNILNMVISEIKELKE